MLRFESNHSLVVSALDLFEYRGMRFGRLSRRRLVLVPEGPHVIVVLLLQAHKLGIVFLSSLFELGGCVAQSGLVHRDELGMLLDGLCEAGVVRVLLSRNGRGVLCFEIGERGGVLCAQSVKRGGLVRVMRSEHRLVLVTQLPDDICMLLLYPLELVRMRSSSLLEVGACNVWRGIMLRGEMRMVVDNLSNASVTLFLLSR